VENEEALYNILRAARMMPSLDLNKNDFLVQRTWVYLWMNISLST